MSKQIRTIETTMHSRDVVRFVAEQTELLRAGESFTSQIDGPDEAGNIVVTLTLSREEVTQ